MSFFSNVKAFFFVFIYFGLFYLLISNNIKTYDDITENSKNIMPFQETQFDTLLKNDILSHDILKIDNYKKDGFYNVDTLNFKHNISCDTNPSILVAPYCYEFQSNDLLYNIYKYEIYMIEQFDNYKPIGKNINSNWDKTINNIKNFKLENMRIYFDVLLTKNETYKENKYLNENFYKEFKLHFESLFVFNIFIGNYFYFDQCRDIFYDLILPLMNIQDCIHKYNNKTHICNFLGEKDTCCAAYIFFNYDKEKYAAYIQKFKEMDKNINYEDISVVFIKNYLRFIGLYEIMVLQKYDDWLEKARFFNMTISDLSL